MFPVIESERGISTPRIEARTLSQASAWLERYRDLWESIRFEKAQVDLPSDREVRVIRDFRAPRELVYRAYTEPALMRRWLLGPPRWSMPICEMDVRVGGQYRWRWRSDEEGKEFGFHGEFHEVSAPERIVHTQYYDPGDVGQSGR